MLKRVCTATYIGLDIVSYINLMQRVKIDVHINRQICLLRRNPYDRIFDVVFRRRQLGLTYFTSNRRHSPIVNSATMSVQEYIDKHDLTKKVEDAINATVKAKADEPMSFLVRIRLLHSI